MAVKQTYIATATWTAADLANIFRSAFIDGGYMTEWFDSFSNGSVENRVLEVTYDGAKTYGKTYYWFKFTTGGVFFSYCTGWNTATDLPIGTVGLDHTGTTTNATTGHDTMMSMVTSATTTLVRYTSTSAGAQTWFLLRHGASSFVFSIDKPGTAIRSHIELNRNYHCGLNMIALPSPNQRIVFSQLYALRRSYAFSFVNAGSTSWNCLTIGSFVYQFYRITGVGSSWVNTVNAIGGNGISPNQEPRWIMPLAQAASNPAFASDQIPIVTGVAISQTTSTVLPPDIGIVPHYPNNTLAAQDRFIVAAGTNEWEILGVSNGGAANENCTVSFAARLV